VSAFAAIVSLEHRDPLVRHHDVAAALAEIYGTTPLTQSADGCVLLAAPLPGSAADCCVMDAAAEAGAVGHVLLEDRASLARELELPAGAAALHVCLAAYLRWGPRCTSRLSGEYSFSVWDT